MGLPRKAEQKADKKEINFFEVSVNCENNTVRAVCYDLNRRPLLEKFNEESKSCCMLNAEKSDDDVIILDPKSLNSRFLCSQCEKETQHNIFRANYTESKPKTNRVFNCFCHEIQEICNVSVIFCCCAYLHKCELFSNKQSFILD